MAVFRAKVGGRGVDDIDAVIEEHREDVVDVLLLGREGADRRATESERRDHQAGAAEGASGVNGERGCGRHVGMIDDARRRDARSREGEHVRRVAHQKVAFVGREVQPGQRGTVPIGP